MEERRILQKEENLEKKGALLDERETELIQQHKLAARQEEELKVQNERYQHLVAEQEHAPGATGRYERHRGQGISPPDHGAGIRADAARLVKRIETEAREHADRKAKDIMGLAIKRYASADYVAEQTVSVLALPNEEMKNA